MGIRINALTETTSPNNTDNGVLDTSAGTRRITWSNIKAAIFGAINGLTSKSTPVGADVIAIGDSAASFAGKKAPLNTLGSAIISYAKLSDVKAANTAGGTFTSGAWQTRVINTEDMDSGSIVSLSSNQFTLDAGKYRFYIKAPAYFVGRHKAVLYNVTDAANALIGTSENCTSPDDVVTSSVVCGEITISGTKTFEVRHRCQNTQATNGLGLESNFGVSEVYTIVELWKVA